MREPRLQATVALQVDALASDVLPSNMTLEFKHEQGSRYCVLAHGKEIGEIHGDYPFYPDVAWQGYFIVNGWEFNFGCECLESVIDLFKSEIPRFLRFPDASSPKHVRETWVQLNHSRYRRCL